MTIRITSIAKLEKELQKFKYGSFHYNVENKLLFLIGMAGSKEYSLSAHPDPAREAVKENQDRFDQFIDECCVTENERSRVAPKDLYAIYRTWSIESGYRTMAKNRVFAEMTKRFGEKKIIQGYFYFFGVRLYDSLYQKLHVRSDYSNR